MSMDSGLSFIAAAPQGAGGDEHVETDEKVNNGKLQVGGAIYEVSQHDATHLNVGSEPSQRPNSTQIENMHASSTLTSLRNVRPSVLSSADGKPPTKGWQRAGAALLIVVGGIVGGCIGTAIGTAIAPGVGTYVGAALGAAAGSAYVYRMLSKESNQARDSFSVESQIEAPGVQHAAQSPATHQAAAAQRPEVVESVHEQDNPNVENTSVQMDQRSELSGGSDHSAATRRREAAERVRKLENQRVEDSLARLDQFAASIGIAAEDLTSGDRHFISEALTQSVEILRGSRDSEGALTPISQERIDRLTADQLADVVEARRVVQNGPSRNELQQRQQEAMDACGSALKLLKRRHPAPTSREFADAFGRAIFLSNRYTAIRKLQERKPDDKYFSGEDLQDDFRLFMHRSKQQLGISDAQATKMANACFRNNRGFKDFYLGLSSLAGAKVPGEVQYTAASMESFVWNTFHTMVPRGEKRWEAESSKLLKSPSAQKAGVNAAVQHSLAEFTIPQLRFQLSLTRALDHSLHPAALNAASNPTANPTTLPEQPQETAARSSQAEVQESS